MSLRPLALAVGLTLGDYLLWNWSLNSNRDVIALIAGLTLPPLFIACVWFGALSIARMIGGRRGLISRRTARRALGPVSRDHTPAQTAVAAQTEAAAGGGEAAPGSHSGRLAA